MEELIARLQWLWIEHSGTLAVVFLCLVIICLAIRGLSNNNNIEED